jgi:hypothetical protein
MREAIEDVEIGFRQLEFAIKLLSFRELGRIDPREFDSDHLVQLATANLHYPSRNFQDTDSLIRAASVNVVISAAKGIRSTVQACVPADIIGTFVLLPA